MTAREWVSLFGILMSAAGTLAGLIIAGRANRRSRRTEQSAEDLGWVRQAKAETQAAEVKALKAETSADQANMRAERAERRMELGEQRMGALETRMAAVDEWILSIVDAAHDDSVDLRELRRRINGGPPERAAQRAVRRT